MMTDTIVSIITALQESAISVLRLSGSEAVEIANNTPFGLAAYFFTDNYKRGIFFQENLDFGILGWNDGLPSTAQAPFGGMKESGIGSEGGIEGIQPYLETKYLSIGNI